MSVSNSNPSSKPSNVALFTDEATSALKATQEIQDNVHKLLDTFTSWRSLQPEASMSKVKDTIKVIQACQSKLEKTASSFSKLPDMQPVALGNSGLVTLDSGEDKSPLYRDLLQAYSWVSKLNTDANKALKHLKRKYPEPEQFLPEEHKRPKDILRFLKDICPAIRSQNPDLSIDVISSTVPCLQVVLKGVLNALLVFSGGILDRVIIRSDFEKSTNSSTKNVDLCTPSEYITFRQISDVAQAAILNISSSETERSVKEFVKWLSLYRTLFSDKCELCKKHLKADTREGHLLPPCWRDTSIGKPYHLTCR